MLFFSGKSSGRIFFNQIKQRINILLSPDLLSFCFFLFWAGGPFLFKNFPFPIFSFDLNGALRTKGGPKKKPPISLPHPKEFLVIPESSSVCEGARKMHTYD